MLWFKKMPDAVVRRFVGDGTEISVRLVRTFRKEGKLWCEWDGYVLLLRDDGSCLGDDVCFLRWEFI
jgi:hypothetical protein